MDWRGHDFRRRRRVDDEAPVTDLGRRRADLAAVAVAIGGAWMMWSAYSSASAASWFYERLERVRSLSANALPDPNFDLQSLPWKTVSPRVFDLAPSALTLVTSAEPYGYQVLATIATKRAGSVDIVFSAHIQSGGATIGVLQDGNWIISNSSDRPGDFAEANTAELRRSRSITVAIANDNAEGESRLTIRSLRVYLR